MAIPPSSITLCLSPSSPCCLSSTSSSLHGPRAPQVTPSSLQSSTSSIPCSSSAVPSHWPPNYTCIAAVTTATPSTTASPTAPATGNNAAKRPKQSRHSSGSASPASPYQPSSRQSAPAAEASTYAVAASEEVGPLCPKSRQGRRAACHAAASSVLPNPKRLRNGTELWLTYGAYV